MQKIVIRKLRLKSTENDYNYMNNKTEPSSECAAFEKLIQQEIDDGWKVINVSSSYDDGWHCHVIVFVLEREVYVNEVKKE